MEIQEILSKLGLSEHESAAYRALLERGTMSISDICRTAKIHRPAAYQAIASLKIRGLISETPHGKRIWFAAEPPSRLEASVFALTKSLQGAIPELENIYQKSSKRPVIKFLEGKVGLTAVYDDIVGSLDKGDVFYRYSSRNTLTTDANKYLSPQYREIRDKKQLQRLVITNEQVSKEKKPRMERDVKTIPLTFDPFDYNITQIIYGKKTALIDNNTETALIIENEKIARFFEKLFKLLYSKL